MNAGRLFESAGQLTSAARANRWCPHTPHPKQKEFLALNCREALYGGAAGGGKSDALLMAALQHVDVPGYAAIIFRRSLTDAKLADAIMDRADEWLRPTAARFITQDRTWVFPSGATLSFGFLNEEPDRFRYQSAAFQYVAFDELTQFPEHWYRYLLSRLRRLVGSNIPVRMRAASNPGNVGHKWVKARFVIEDRPDGCEFVPARLEDNPSIDQAGYIEMLDQLDSITRAQLREGNWEADGAGLVYRFDTTLNTIPELPVPRTDPRWRWILMLDFGATAQNSIGWLGWLPHDPVTYIAQSYRFSGTPSDVAEEVKPQLALWKPVKIIGDVGGLGKGYSEEMRKHHGIPVEPAQKENKRGYQLLMNGDMEHALVKAVRDDCADLIGEWETLPLASNGAEEAKGFVNHCADGALYGWRGSRSYLAKPKKDEPKKGSEAEEERRIVELERDIVLDEKGLRRRRGWLRRMG